MMVPEEESCSTFGGVMHCKYEMRVKCLKRLLGKAA